MSVALVAIGDELLLGETREANAAALAVALRRRGLQLGSAHVIGDSRGAIAEMLARLTPSTKLLVLSGGLGPTDDDFTRAAVAESVGVALVRDAEAEATLRARYAQRGRVVSEPELRQAERPEGSLLQPNRFGTAPGFLLRIGTCVVVTVPGVPREVLGMFGDHLDAWLREAGLATETPPHEPLLRVFGAAESEVAARVRPLPGYDRVHVRSLPHFPEIRLRIQPARDGESDWRAAAEFADRAAEALGWRVFARDDDAADLASCLLAELGARGQTIAVAESCTGGRILDRLTDVPGASASVVGGVVAYANAVKIDALGVDGAVLDEHGAVSEPVVAAMAAGVRARLGADLGVATSGIAGPAGGTAEKPVGTICIGVADAAGVQSWRLVFPGLSRDRFKELVVWTALARARQRLASGR
ncbi:MAG: hypothetical protein RIT45_3946 [Pseudomonadota bacterium]|jgi:nicotinamide-nucleotide amidase